MKKTSRILIYLLVLMGLGLFLFTTCKKTSDDNNTGWTAEDQTYYNNVITLQDQADENYTVLLQTMDSLEAINQLQQFFLSDPSVTSATIGSQGIAVQYSNGIRGGIFLNPEDEFEVDTLPRELFPKMSSSDLNEKSRVNIKKAIFLNPSYWERSGNANSVIASYNLNLPRVSFSFQNIYKGMDASLDRFTQLAGYGFIHIYSHGWAWPKKQNFAEVYLLTGEKVSDNTSGKYWDDIEKGNIMIAKAKTYFDKKDNVYFISEKFVASHNDFSKDTILFYGGFCFSYLGTWPEIESTFADGAYFGFTWRVQTSWNCMLAKNLIEKLSDTMVTPPVNTENWITNPNPAKQRWDSGDNKYCQIQYTGDATLTLWKDTAAIVTSPITNITQTSATGGGNIKSDGGFPVTVRGVCWNNSSNPTIANSHTTDGSGTGVFVSNLTGLTLNTSYYVRAYATNSKGTMYGNQVSFTTTAGHYIGESFGGGIIFYIDGTGQHGLIAATSDQGPETEWGCFEFPIGGTSTAIGTGQANTTAIVNGCGEAGIPARICDDLVLNGYDDWFLPSIDELYQMFLRMGVIGGFLSYDYWSSSECTDIMIMSAWRQRFLTGDTECHDKRANGLVRAIRAF